MVKKGKTIPVNAYRKLGSCYSSIGVLEQYIASGTVNGFNFAIICYQSDRRDACGYNHCIITGISGKFTRIMLVLL